MASEYSLRDACTISEAHTNYFCFPCSTFLLILHAVQQLLLGTHISSPVEDNERTNERTRNFLWTLLEEGKKREFQCIDYGGNNDFVIWRAPGDLQEMTARESLSRSATISILAESDSENMNCT